jgi:hypothetical protein
MIGVKQQFEREREEQDAKLVQVIEHQEVENIQIRQKIGEIQEVVEHHKAEVDREVTSVKTTVDSIQKELEVSMGNVSGRLREQKSQLETEIKNLHEKVELIKAKTREGTQGAGNEIEETMEINVAGPSRGHSSRTTNLVVGGSTIELSKIPGNLGHNEFALPNFDESKGMNPVAHVRQLEEFFQFRGIPQKLWLIVAKKSIVGSVSKQWLEATNTKFSSYEHFKSEFLATWWSAAQQGLVKCKLYQSKYDKTAGLSLSAHFLKFATMASYLEPKLTDCEIIEALRCHYPQEIQKMLSQYQIEFSGRSFGGPQEIRINGRKDHRLRYKSKT